MQRIYINEQSSYQSSLVLVHGKLFGEKICYLKFEAKEHLPLICHRVCVDPDFGILFSFQE